MFWDALFAIIRTMVLSNKKGDSRSPKTRTQGRGGGWWLVREEGKPQRQEARKIRQSVCLSEAKICVYYRSKNNMWPGDRCYRIFRKVEM